MPLVYNSGTMRGVPKLLLTLGINISQQTPARATDVCYKSYKTSRRLSSASAEPQSCHNPQLRLHRASNRATAQVLKLPFNVGSLLPVAATE